jgi:hypothetical protein
MFAGFEITFSDNTEWTVLNYNAHALNGADVIAVPVTVTNRTRETDAFSSVFMTVISPNGEKLSNINGMFRNSVHTPDLRPGATYNGVTYVLYDGDGEYTIQFKRSREPYAELRFTVQR